MADIAIDFRRFGSLTNTVVDIPKTAAANYSGTYWYGGQYDNLANAAITYIQFFNKKAADVLLGTTAPDFVLTLPIGKVVHFSKDKRPLLFDIGFSFAATTTKTGNTAPVTAIDATPYFTEC